MIESLVNRLVKTCSLFVASSNMNHANRVFPYHKEMYVINSITISTDVFQKGFFEMDTTDCIHCLLMHVHLIPAQY